MGVGPRGAALQTLLMGVGEQRYKPSFWGAGSRARNDVTNAASGGRGATLKTLLVGVGERHSGGSREGYNTTNSASWGSFSLMNYLSIFKNLLASG